MQVASYLKILYREGICKAQVTEAFTVGKRILYIKGKFCGFKYEWLHNLQVCLHTTNENFRLLFYFCFSYYTACVE